MLHRLHCLHCPSACFEDEQHLDVVRHRNDTARINFQIALAHSTARCGCGWEGKRRLDQVSMSSAVQCSAVWYSFSWMLLLLMMRLNSERTSAALPNPLLRGQRTVWCTLLAVGVGSWVRAFGYFETYTTTFELCLAQKRVWSKYHGYGYEMIAFNHSWLVAAVVRFFLVVGGCCCLHTKHCSPWKRMLML